MNNIKSDNLLVSVCVQTYNHEKYIKQCLDSILAQVTSFDFEIILGEDDSNDNTRNICIDYAKNSPEKIKLFLRHRKDVIYINNVPTGRYNFISNLNESRGKYIALCEGDDYWTDKNKLQKQVDFLKSKDITVINHMALVDNDIYDSILLEFSKEKKQVDRSNKEKARRAITTINKNFTKQDEPLFSKPSINLEDKAKQIKEIPVSDDTVTDANLKNLKMIQVLKRLKIQLLLLREYLKKSIYQILLISFKKLIN